jgi:hypothetical protein
MTIEEYSNKPYWIVAPNMCLAEGRGQYSKIEESKKVTTKELR